MPSRDETINLSTMGRGLKIFKKIIFCFLFLIFSKGSWATDGPLGHWYGFFEWDGKNRMALRIKESSHGDFEARYDNLQSGEFGMLFNKVSVTEKTFHGVYEPGEEIDLTMEGKDSLKGAIRKDGKSYPVELRRGDDYSIPRVDSRGMAVTDYAYQRPSATQDGWETADVRSVGGDPSKLEAAVRAILNSSYPNIHSLVVVRRGKLVLDEYFYGYGPQEEQSIQSVTKSVLSTLFGIAKGKGLLNTSQKLYDYFPTFRDRPGWDPRKNKITLGMVLSMKAGYACDDLNGGDPAQRCSLDHATDWLDFSLAQPLDHDPGSHFNYCSSCLIPLGVLMARQSGLSVPDFAQRYLYDPLGIQAKHWGKGPDGITEVAGSHWMRPRDIAKLGLLYLNKGNWKGTQILPEEWVEEATSPKPAGDGIPPPGGRPNYGYLWWCSKIHTDYGDIPSYHAAGRGGQLIIVVPKLALVCVITAGNYAETGHEIPEMELFMKYIYASFS